MLNATFCLISRNIGGAIAPPAPPLPTALSEFQKSSKGGRVKVLLINKEGKKFPKIFFEKVLKRDIADLQCFVLPSRKRDKVDFKGL